MKIPTWLDNFIFNELNGFYKKIEKNDKKRKIASIGATSW